MTPIRSIYGIEEGQHAVMLQYSDSSDHGLAQEFFDTVDQAEARADEIREGGLRGDFFHPGPDSSDMRVFRIERIA